MHATQGASCFFSFNEEQLFFQLVIRVLIKSVHAPELSLLLVFVLECRISFFVPIKAIILAQTLSRFAGSCTSVARLSCKEHPCAL